MPYAPLLTADALGLALAELPEWQRDGDTVTRTVRRASFRDAIALVDRVAEAAEAADHHPDIEIVWRRVTFRLTSKASGGLTAKDMEMAATIDRIAAEQQLGRRGFREAFPIIAAADVDRLTAFYVAGFGFEPGYRFPAEGAVEYVFLRLPPLGIGIARRSADAAAAEAPPADRSWELWIYADDADVAVAHIAELGASVLEAPADQPWGERVALVTDPEGNRIRIGSVPEQTRG